MYMYDACICCKNPNRRLMGNMHTYIYTCIHTHGTHAYIHVRTTQKKLNRRLMGNVHTYIYTCIHIHGTHAYIHVRTTQKKLNRRLMGNMQPWTNDDEKKRNVTVKDELPADEVSAFLDSAMRGWAPVGIYVYMHIPVCVCVCICAY